MFTIRLFNLWIAAASIMITACAPSVAPPSALPAATSAPTLAAAPVLEPNMDAEAWSESLPPNGVWQVTLTPEEFVQRGVSRYVAEEEWAGVYTWTFQDGKAQLDFVGPIKTGTFTCLAEYAAVDGVVRLTFASSVLAGPCAGALDEVQWRLDDDGLHFHLVASSRGPFVEIQTTYEAKPFQKISDL
jgi:hypothetical protein